MAELTINAADIAAALRKHVDSYTPTLAAEQVGQVLEVGDGVARVAGLPNTSVNEILEFEGGLLGLALNLDEDSIGAVVLGAADGVEEGRGGQRTGGVVDDDHGGPTRHRSQPGPDRPCPGGAAGHHGIGTPGVVGARPGDGKPGGRPVSGRVGCGRHHQDHPIARGAGGPDGPGGDRRSGQGEELLAGAEALSGAAGHDDGPDGPRWAQGSASLRRTSAVSSSTPRAKVSSDTRIWRARWSMRFSPAERPLSLSRMERFRTTSATW